MAKPEHLAILRQGVEVWNAWRKEHRNIRPEFQQANFRGAYLSGVDLFGADLTRANFQGADLRRATLGVADLTRANLRRANLTGAKFYRTLLRGADLSEVRLVGADFTEVDLRGTNFQNADLRSAKLREANLAGLNFRGANLEEVDLTRATLQGADLRRAKFRGATLEGVDLTRANLQGVNLTVIGGAGKDLAGVNLVEINAQGKQFQGVQLQESSLARADLRGIKLQGANLREADLTGLNLAGVDLSGSDLRGVKLQGANLRGANLTEVDLSGGDLREADLQRASLIQTRLNYALLTECKVYGLAVWDVRGTPQDQSSLIITPPNAPTVTVDDLEVAQFIYLLLNRAKLRNVINTITSRAVLILGRFTPERKAVLDAMADELRKHNLLPIIFDFEGATTRDVTETIKTLASLSLFVIADITNPKSAPLELQATVPDYQIPFVAIIQEGERPFSMFSDLPKYPWVLTPVIEYPSVETLLQGFKRGIIDRAWAKHQELVKQKNKAIETQSIEDFMREDEDRAIE